MTFDFSSLEAELAFAFDVSTKQIIGASQSFKKTFQRMSKSEINQLMDFVVQKLIDLESISFNHVLQTDNEMLHINAKCQYIDFKKKQIICYLYTDLTNTLLPLDYLILADTIPCGIMIVDIENDFYRAEYANNGLLHMLGYTRQECKTLFQHNVLSFIYEEDIANGVQSYKQQITATNSFYLTGRVIKKDGSKLWVNFLGKWVTGSSGKKFLFTVLTNISETISLIEQLNQERQALDALKNVVHGAAFKYDFKLNTISFFGNQVKTLVGKTSSSYDMDDFCAGKTILQMDLKEIKKIVASIKKGQKRQHTINVIDKMGETHMMQIRFSFIHDDSMKNIAIIGNVEDVTETMKAREYYDKALSLWNTKNDDYAAALTVNLTHQRVICGFSQIVTNINAAQMTFGDYCAKLSTHILNKSERKRFAEQMSMERLIRSYNEKNIRLNYEFEIDVHRTHKWYSLEVFLVQNPKSGDLMALFRWKDINSLKLRKKIDDILFSETYDFICLIFAKTDSYSMIMNMEDNKIIPDMVTSGYTALIRNVIGKYADQDLVQYLLFCFSLKNLKNQLSLSDSYAFVGRGFYPGGSPTVKYHAFRYIDEKNQVMLYTRRDITDQSKSFSFKEKNKIVNVELSEIVYIESNGKKSTVFTHDHQYEANEMLTSMQERLPGKEFVRCHRCYIVRYSAIKQIVQSTAILSNGSTIPISRAHIDLLKKRFN